MLSLSSLRGRARGRGCGRGPVKKKRCRRGGEKSGLCEFFPPLLFARFHLSSSPFLSLLLPFSLSNSHLVRMLSVAVLVTVAVTVVVRADVPGLSVGRVAAGGSVAARPLLLLRLRLCSFRPLPRQHRSFDVPDDSGKVVPSDPEHPARVHLFPGVSQRGAHERCQGVDRAEARLELPQGALAGGDEEEPRLCLPRAARHGNGG